MNLATETSESPKTTLPAKRETGEDIATSGNHSSLPSRPRVDDKAARLESELERTLKRVDNGKFILAFVGAIAALIVSSAYIPSYAFAVVTILVIILLIALAFHWNFPEVRRPLSQLFQIMLGKLDKSRNAPPSDDETE